MTKRCVVWMTAFVVVALAGCALPLGAAEKPPEKVAEPPAITGKVASVTLYRGQALVTRVVPVEGAAGPVELLVGGLPQGVVPDSLFAEGAEGLDVRSVRFRTRAVGQEPREEVRKLDDQLEALVAGQLGGKVGHLDQEAVFLLPQFRLARHEQKENIGRGRSQGLSAVSSPGPRPGRRAGVRPGR